MNTVATSEEESNRKINHILRQKLNREIGKIYLSPREELKSLLELLKKVNYYKKWNKFLLNNFKFNIKTYIILLK